ncbi:MAG: hypothetical protein HC859_04760 [Bacteroidia bacterium]|nr:hypothetical protein [Bacteroidia bacterium]
MKYEDFVADPLAHLRKAYNHVALGDAVTRERYFMEELKTTETYKTNTYQPVDAKLRELLTRRWGFVFDAFGYEK